MVQLINPLELAKAKGYSHAAMAEGRVVALAGQIGWDRDAVLVSPEFASQFQQALSNLLTSLQAAGGGARDLISLRVYVTDKQKYLASIKEVGAAYRLLLGKHFPAMALVQVADLLEPGALVEIEGMA